LEVVVMARSLFVVPGMGRRHRYERSPQTARTLFGHQFVCDLTNGSGLAGPSRWPAVDRESALAAASAKVLAEKVSEERCAGAPTCECGPSRPATTNKEHTMSALTESSAADSRTRWSLRSFHKEDSALTPRWRHHRARRAVESTTIYRVTDCLHK